MFTTQVITLQDDLMLYKASYIFTRQVTILKSIYNFTRQFIIYKHDITLRDPL